MFSYRVYYLDESGRITEADWIEAASDTEAQILIRARKLAVECELWKQGQLLCRIPPAVVLG